MFLGNWGAGAFQGYNKLKCLIQLIACALNNRNIIYCTFDDSSLLLEMSKMFSYLNAKDITVGMKNIT
jgi:Poly (ADP-ribose) glycohydrolase (PARG)